MIDAEARISSKEHNEHLSARQSCIQTIVRFLLVCPALLENHAHIADSEVAWPAVTDTFLYELATCLAHPAQVIGSRKTNSLILWQRSAQGSLFVTRRIRAANDASSKGMLPGSNRANFLNCMAVRQSTKQ